MWDRSDFLLPSLVLFFLVLLVFTQFTQFNGGVEEEKTNFFQTEITVVIKSTISTLKTQVDSGVVNSWADNISTPTCTQDFTRD